ncbi:synaptojanin-2-binding protein-like [Corticium candelabrum]|uniref:synaptojanin-2-binding protein-like n=1 Tax=Corticium candelabrum TaxID=121492 RepID=UPI002E265E67|nr:synaptojanin-2-binding protein-like [Corticium candelabrum]
MSDDSGNYDAGISEEEPQPEKEVVEVILDKRERGLGFNIRGGVDNRYLPDDPGIFVTTIKPDGAAARDGRLQRGDQILEINGENVQRVKHFEAVQLFHKSKEQITLLIKKGVAPNPPEEVQDYKVSAPVQGMYRKHFVLGGLVLVAVALVFWRYTRH